MPKGRKRVCVMTKKEFIAINVNEATKASLLDALKSLPKGVTDKNLLDRVKYTVNQAAKSIRKVTVADLKDLVTEAQEFLSNAPAPVEASKKPSLTRKKQAEDADAGAEVEESDAPQKSGKKSLKGKVQTAPQRSPKASNFLPVAKMFPEELSFEAEDGEKTLIRVHEKYHSMDEVREAINNGVTLFIAAYWTRAHIKKYGYQEMFYLMNGAPTNFPDDLDILNIVVACDTMDRVFAMSTYTEAMYRFDKPDFEPVEDEDPADGSKFTVRVSNGMEFEVYEMAE